MTDWMSCPKCGTVNEYHEGFSHFVEVLNYECQCGYQLITDGRAKAMPC